MYDPARVWRFTDDPLGHGGLRIIGNPVGGSEERQDPVAQRAVYGRPDHAMVGRFKNSFEPVSDHSEVLVISFF